MYLQLIPVALVTPQAMAAMAASAGEGVPRSYSSLDEALLQRMAAARLTPQLLSALMHGVEQVSPCLQCAWLKKAVSGTWQTLSCECGLPTSDSTD